MVGRIGFDGKSGRFCPGIPISLSLNQGKSFKFYSLQGQNFKIFLIFTYNQGKAFLILPITQGGTVYLVSTGSCPPPLAKRSLTRLKLSVSC